MKKQRFLDRSVLIVSQLFFFFLPSVVACNLCELSYICPQRAVAQTLCEISQNIYLLTSWEDVLPIWGKRLWCFCFFPSLLPSPLPGIMKTLRNTSSTLGEFSEDKWFCNKWETVTAFRSCLLVFQFKIVIFLTLRHGLIWLMAVIWIRSLSGLVR